MTTDVMFIPTGTTGTAGGAEGATVVMPLAVGSAARGITVGAGSA